MEDQIKTLSLRMIFKSSVFETKFLKCLRNWWMYYWEFTGSIKKLNFMFSFLMLTYLMLTLKNKTGFL